MSPSPLVAKLQSHATLLPTQRELLERVLFQIEFNGFQHIHLMGGTGSGKTTLSLVLAELLSESMNLAYFAAQPDMTTAQCQKHLLQQWFGLGEYDGNLMEQLEQPHAQPLVWILDGQGSLPLGCLSLLRAHPIHIITTGPDALPEADLNLAISPVTEAEAEQLLPVQMLETRSASERLQAAAGNLHRLLEPELLAQDGDSRPVAASAQYYRTASLLLALLGVLAIVLFWWLYQPSEPEDVVADNQQGTRMPAAWSPVAPEPMPELSLGDHDAPDALADEAEPEPAVSEPAVTESLSEPQSEALTAPAVLSVAEEPIAEQRPPSGPIEPSSNAADAAPAETTTAWQHDEAALLAMEEGHYVLQLGAFASPGGAEAVRQAHPELAMLIYQRQQNGRSQWVVVLASYPTANQARAMRADVPDTLRADTPFIKAMQQVWQEIRSSQPVQGNGSS